MPSDHELYFIYLIGSAGETYLKKLTTKMNMALSNLNDNTTQDRSYERPVQQETTQNVIMDSFSKRSTSRFDWEMEMEMTCMAARHLQTFSRRKPAAQILSVGFSHLRPDAHVLPIPSVESGARAPARARVLRRAELRVLSAPRPLTTYHPNQHPGG